MYEIVNNYAEINVNCTSLQGPISYQYLDKYTTNFTTEPKDRSLNLAISANYPNYNKGMQWARCSGDISSELMKMELEPFALNESSILVKWNSGSVCASILKGYNLTFCLATFDEKCSSIPTTVELLREKQEYKNYTISNLPPYTNVCLTMLMYSSTRLGRRSDLYCTRTKASGKVTHIHTCGCSYVNICIYYVIYLNIFSSLTSKKCSFPERRDNK